MTAHHLLATSLRDAFQSLRHTPWARDVPLAQFQAFLAEDPSRVHREGPEHFTASAMVFTPDLSQTLLCFHGKGNMWVQLGGHMEAEDESPADAALREAREESGLQNFSFLTTDPIELHRHGLAATFGSCHAHWDVVYALTIPYAEPWASDESREVRWFPVDALPEGCADGFKEQFEAVLARARSIA